MFSASAGVMYTIAPDGVLRWYRHDAFLTGGRPDAPGAWENRTDVGYGWGGFAQVFAAGQGLIYVVTHDGQLLRYRHRGYLSCNFARDPAQPVATGWEPLRWAFAQP